MRPVGAAIVPSHNLKEKSDLWRSLGMPISDLFNLCYNQSNPQNENEENYFEIIKNWSITIGNDKTSHGKNW